MGGLYTCVCVYGVYEREGEGHRDRERDSALFF